MLTKCRWFFVALSILIFTGVLAADSPPAKKIVVDAETQKKFNKAMDALIVACAREVKDGNFSSAKEKEACDNFLEAEKHRKAARNGVIDACAYQKIADFAAVAGDAYYRQKFINFVKQRYPTRYVSVLSMKDDASVRLKKKYFDEFLRYEIKKDLPYYRTECIREMDRKAKTTELNY